MTPEARTKLRNLLINHESFSQFPYSDTTGHVTIGIGRNLTDRGISHVEAIALLDNDISYFTTRLQHYLPWFQELDENRQIALIDLCFNVGIQNFLSFQKMLVAIEAKDYYIAAKEMINSKWASQVGHRAFELSAILESGELS